MLILVVLKIINLLLDRKNIDNQFNTDTTIVNKGFADAIENAKGDSFLINKILKRKSNINENVNANIEEQLKGS
jgi:predicted negative regulator of RcsB-dependent stress response